MIGRRLPQIAALTLLLAGCAAPEPVLYPNERLKQVGQTQGEHDIAECHQLAETSGAPRDPNRLPQAATAAGGGALIGAAAGAVGGAITGNAGTGAAVGAASGATAGLVSNLFSAPPVSPVHRSFVDRCLRERGYEPIGWE